MSGLALFDCLTVAELRRLRGLLATHGAARVLELLQVDAANLERACEPGAPAGLVAELRARLAEVT